MTLVPQRPDAVRPAIRVQHAVLHRALLELEAAGCTEPPSDIAGRAVDGVDLTDRLRSLALVGADVEGVADDLAGRDIEADRLDPPPLPAALNVDREDPAVPRSEVPHAVDDRPGGDRDVGRPVPAPDHLAGPAIEADARLAVLPT